MTLGEIRDRTILGVDEDPASPTTGLVAEVLAAINEGQQLAALLTLCLEKTATVSLTAATCFFTPRTTLNDLIVPLRVTVAGVRLRPSTILEMEALNSAWQSTAGASTRYAFMGCNLLAVSPQAAGGATASVNYAYSPALLIEEDAEPEIPKANHMDLVRYGIYKVRLKEGAQGLERGLVKFNEFLDGCQRLGDFIRAKSSAARLDVLPFELALFDRSGMIPSLKKAKAKAAV